MSKPTPTPERIEEIRRRHNAGDFADEFEAEIIADRAVADLLAWGDSLAADLEAIAECAASYWIDQKGGGYWCVYMLGECIASEATLASACRSALAAKEGRSDGTAAAARKVVGE